MREREAFFKEACQKKDKEYQDLAYVQVQGIEECQRLREERDTAKGELNQLKDELTAKDRHIDKLEGDNRSLENLKIDLENHVIVIQERLDKVEENRALATKIPPGELKPIIEKWKEQSKPTRDWTKANQLLSEIENLFSPQEEISTQEPNPIPIQEATPELILTPTPTTSKISFSKLKNGDILQSKIDGKKYQLEKFCQNRGSESSWIAWVIPKDGKIKPRGKKQQIWKSEFEDYELIPNNN